MAQAKKSWNNGRQTFELPSANDLKWTVTVNRRWDSRPPKKSAFEESVDKLTLAELEKKYGDVIRATADNVYIGPGYDGRYIGLKVSREEADYIRSCYALLKAQGQMRLYHAGMFDNLRDKDKDEIDKLDIFELTDRYPYLMLPRGSSFEFGSDADYAKKNYLYYRFEELMAKQVIDWRDPQFMEKLNAHINETGINPITGKPATQAEKTTAKLYTPVKVVSNVLAVVALLKGPVLVTRYQTSRFSNLKTTSDVDLPKNNPQTIAEVTEQTTGNYISPRTSRINSDLVEELASQNVKYNPDEMIIIGKDSSGKILWLEKGNERARLEHIISRHGDEFIQKAIPLDSIPDYLMDSLEYGELIGYQGRGQGRPIYELTVNGEVKRVAITVGDNGFIVGANPVSSK